MEQRSEGRNIEAYGFPHQPLLHRSNALFQSGRWSQRETSHVYQKDSSEAKACSGSVVQIQGRAPVAAAELADLSAGVQIHSLQPVPISCGQQSFYLSLICRTVHFFPRCCDTSWWSALVTNTFMLNWGSLEIRRGFTTLPGLSCLPWAQAVWFPLMSLQQTFWSCYFPVLLCHCHLAVSAKTVAHIRNCKYRWQERIPELDNSV